MIELTRSRRAGVALLAAAALLVAAPVQAQAPESLTLQLVGELALHQAAQALSTSPSPS